jgi:ADP-ribosylglycohydrolase
VLEWIALGDAYGACFEYANPGPTRPNDLSGYPPHPRHHRGPGRYTDDTQMSIAVAETLLGGDLSRSAFADAFVRCFRRDPRNGYSHRMQAFIESCRDGADLLDRIRPQSVKSGAAMRATPIGTLPDEEAVLRVASLQACITHDTSGGVASAQAVALAAHALRYDRCRRTELPVWIAARVTGVWDQPWTGRVGSAGVDSARAAIWAVANHAGMAGLLKECVDLTGDVDTVAAMALGIAACDKTMVHNVPRVLIDGLEDGSYGRRFLGQLGARLLGGHR